jgi:hypothetical protein
MSFALKWRKLCSLGAVEVDQKDGCRTPWYRLHDLQEPLSSNLDERENSVLIQDGGWQNP